MCGIIAIAGKNLEQNRYDKTAMLSSLTRRGPDGEGERLFKSCWLGHRRLSIIDVEGGAQPMSDGHLSISFNGEIYNYKELRKKLESLGHSFVSNSDTEVILKSYRQYGTDAPKHLDGMFAFALWDEDKQSLFLARDRFGKKPLYYCFDGENILVASEIKALFASGKIRGVLDKEAVDNYLRLMYVPTWKSVYKNIHQLPAAHWGLFLNGKLEINRYWKVPFSPLSISYEDAKIETKRLIQEAVKKRMLASDVEVGSLLSGGVDSSYVSILAKDYLNHPLKTFVLGHGKDIDELPFAKQVSEKIGSDHYTLQARGDMVEELESVIQYLDDPHADVSDFPQHLVSKLASTKVKVALSGDGADEIFMGYGWHTRHYHLSYRAHTIEKLILNPFQGRVRATRVFEPLERLALWGSPLPINNKIFTDEYSSNLDSMQNITLFDLTTYLPGQLLTKVDRTSMMHGLEIRSPFLDTALVEFVVNLPTEFKATSKEQKIILKDLLSEFMPKDFVYRRKQGFGSPVTKWLREEKMSRYAQDKLGKGALIRSIFIGLPIDLLLNVFYKKGDNRPVLRIWILLCLEIWLEANKKYHV